MIEYCINSVIFLWFGRYLEDLSQRYRRQMEEMYRSLNKTIGKLTNTSRAAAERVKINAANDIDGLVPDCGIFSALVVKIPQSCIKPSIYIFYFLGII